MAPSIRLYLFRVKKRFFLWPELARTSALGRLFSLRSRLAQCNAGILRILLMRLCCYACVFCGLHRLS